MEFYLRVEAVNLSYFIFDTTDICTVRGGGLLLLSAIHKIENNFKQLKAISTGASAGLFTFTATALENAKALQQQIVEFLSQDKALKQATFVIDTLPVGNNFNEDKEKLIALNRWQQMQSPTVVFPSSHYKQQFARPICSRDQIRPASKTGEKNEIISESVYQRYQYGRKQKQAFYRQQTGLKDLPRFVNDLSLKRVRFFCYPILSWRVLLMETFSIPQKLSTLFAHQ
ncbi:MAG: hypothetical protein DRR19_33120 [Candidatus Parabeggiatoa sp. nov. 1]|nr:MAG: hypothetical protein DRR19_33120 [Gammaproteobacteria bacterium]